MQRTNLNIQLLIIAIVSAVLNFAGFIAVMEDTLFQIFLAAMASTAVFVVIFGFWGLAFTTIPQLQTPKYRLAGWAVVFVGSLGILGISAYWNVVSLAGSEVLNLALEQTSIIAEQHLAEAIANSGSYSSLPPQIAALSASVTALADGEVASGAISGSAGTGGISGTLYQIADKVGGVAASLTQAASEVQQLSQTGQACLADMRVSGGSNNTSQGVDCINNVIAGLNNQVVSDQIAQALRSVTEGIILPSSIRQASQIETVNRILAGIQEQANAIAQHAATLSSEPVAFVSNERPNIMSAVLLNWRSIIPPIATAIAIDLLPVLLLFFVVLGHRDAETHGRNTSTTTLRDVERVRQDMERIDALRSPQDKGDA